ncbi:MAG: efflux transporter outer membrane subunit [Muribaculaceae bacterium]|nr:efflux transporter outer membrane subunit [Muribaculaceae bacterium]
MTFPVKNLIKAASLALFLSVPSVIKAEIRTVADSVPDRWQYVSEYIQTLPSEDRWWQSFHDPVLDSLISLGIDNNFNLLTAMHRIGAARQAVNQAKSRYYPTISISGGWDKSRTSGEMTSPAGRSQTMSYFTAGADMTWEIDLFGRIRQQVNQKKQLYNASRADYAATMVSLCSEIARNYASYRMYQLELAVAHEHLESQDSVMHIAMYRHEAGLNSELDVAQAGTIYYSTKASIPTLESSAATAVNAISLLLGEYPGRVAAMLSRPAPLPDYRQIVATGMPVDLIRRRPDIVAAEYQLAASAMAVGVAKKDFLPVISLQASAGTSAHNLKNMFGKESLTYSIAPSISWTVFDGLSRRAAVESAKEELKISVDAYNLAVVTAVQEVDNAIILYTSAMHEVEALNDVVRSAQESFTLSLDLYRSGLTPFTNVADAQISFLQYADQLVVAQGNALTALINLYAALGGGWTQAQ